MNKAQKQYDENLRRGQESYFAKNKIEKIKNSPEYKRAVQIALGDGIKRRPSERGQIKNQIFQKFIRED